jgi:acetoin utilization deacetylase AcuC-like enzyme
MTIQILTHADCLTHEPGAGHPENPERLANVLNALHNTAINTSLSFHDAPLGTDAQILLAHETSHLERIRETAPDEGEAALDADTRMSPGSLNATLRAVGAACQGVDNLMTENTGAVFCATRPPGHHATPTHAMGFCLFNHVAIAALHAREQYKLERIAIVDFDVHHGNGTQDIMQGREGVFYISTHQSPLYPGTGLEAENINNNILNVPVHGGTGHATYIEIFQETIVPVLQAYQPELIMVSAGFDAHKEDPLAGMALTDETYKWLGTTLQGLANDHCDGKLLSVLEGGYNLSVLPGSVIAYLEGNLEARS